MSSKIVTLSTLFFHELKQYNSTNFKSLYTCDILEENPSAVKAFSSTLTRYFIFCEKHPEFNSVELRMLYFQLKLDMVARYFSEYPTSNIEDLRAFQLELQNYVKNQRGEN